MIEGWGLAAAGIAAAGTIGGAVISGNAAKSAAGQQENAAENATQAQLSMFNQDQANIKPQIQLGQSASTQLEGLLNGTGPSYQAFLNQPGYKAALSQGDAAINKQAAASGNLFSTSTLGALGAYNNGQAQQGYNNYVQQLMQAAGLGNSAGSTVAQAGTATGQGMANNMNLAGSAAAAGTLGQANAFTNALGSNSMGQFGNLLGSQFGGVSNDPYAYMQTPPAGTQWSGSGVTPIQQ